MYKNQPYYVKTNNFSNQKRVTTMIYYLFPRSSIQINLHCKLSYTSSVQTKCYSNSLSKYLKQLNDHAEQHPKWHEILYYKHPYRSLFNNHTTIFYEILEVYHLMNLSLDTVKQDSIHFHNDTVHAMQYIRKKNINDKYVIIQQPSTTEDFVSYSKLQFDTAFCQVNSDDEYKNNIDLILQLCLVFCTMKHKGTCIVKLGDTFSKLSLDVLALLSHFFEKTFILKPTVCPITSSEKYVVCKSFIYNKIGEKMYNTFLNMYNSLLQCPDDKKIYRILQMNIPIFIWGKLEEVNSILGQPRLEQLQSLLVSMEDPLVDYTIATSSDIQKCKEWREKHHLKEN